MNFKWLDFTENDERTVNEMLSEIQSKVNGMNEAVAQLKELLKGIED